jgi:predicted DNA-binding WGR domain protein
MTASDTTYLELSEDGGSAHKFYEVVVAGTQVTIRYGRIGDDGQAKTNSFASAEKAKSAAEKKVAEKVRRGYAPAVMGARGRRMVTRRTITSQRSTAKSAPVLWTFASGAAAFGIFVDSRRCWVGNEDGDVFTLTPGGEPTGRFRLPRHPTAGTCSLATTTPRSIASTRPGNACGSWPPAADPRTPCSTTTRSCTSSPQTGCWPAWM